MKLMPLSILCLSAAIGFSNAVIANTQYVGKTDAVQPANNLNLTRLSCSSSNGMLFAVYQNKKQIPADLNNLYLQYSATENYVPTAMYISASDQVSTKPNLSFNSGIETINTNFKGGTLPQYNVLSITLMGNIPSNACDSLKVLNGPTQTGTITLGNITTKPSGVTENPTVEIDDQKNEKVADVEVPWGKEATIQDLDIGKYIIKPQILKIGVISYRGLANPENVNVNLGKITKSQISYVKKTTDGGLHIAITKPDALSDYTTQIPITLTNEATKDESTTTFTLNQNNIIIKDLVNGDKYDLTSEKIDHNGYECTPTFNPKNPEANNKIPYIKSTLTYKCIQIPMSSVNIQVEGAPNPTKFVKVIFTPSESKDSVPITAKVNLKNGQGDIITNKNFVNGKRYDVASSSVSDYTATFTPATIIATEGGVTEKIAYSKSPQEMRVGYLPQSSVGSYANMKVKISDAVKMGYNMVIVAFGQSKGISSMQYVFDVFQAYDGWNKITATEQSNIKQDIKQSKANGLKYVLISVGGSGNTFALASTEADLKTQSKMMWKFMQDNGYDGVDFDIEESFNGEDLNTLINDLRADAAESHESIIVTCAPQINKVTDGSAEFVSTGVSQDYDPAIKAGNFNYIIVQEGFTSGYTIGGASEKDPSFGINSYKYLTHQLSLPKVSGNSNEVTKPLAYTIPANTKIMIDPLAGPNSAVPNTNTIWHVCNGLTCPNTLWANLNDSYTQLKDQSQFGGPAVWDISHDSYNQCKFIKRVGALFGVDSESIVCPGTGISSSL